MSTKEINLKITGMHCESCEKMVAMELEELPNVEILSISSKTGLAELKVSDHINEAQIIEAVKTAGYEAQVLVQGDQNEN